MYLEAYYEGVFCLQLYSVLTSDLPRIRIIETALYADDTAIYYKSKSHRLITGNLAMEKSEKGMDKWKHNTKLAKTQAILIITKTLPSTRRIANYQKEIDCSPQMKYLGIIDNRLT